MTIGSQLRDLYIEELEKTNGPLVPVTKKMEENEHVQMMLAEAHAAIEQKFTLAAFTILITNDDRAFLHAIHVYARALNGESIGGKPRPEQAHKKFLSQHNEYNILLGMKKFSANPKINADKGVTIDTLGV